jgi:GntR family transcriptional regulator
MALETAPPKYEQVLKTLQQRIENGTYPPGTVLPSEARMSTEFETSRTTIIKALSILRQEGWIESHQGKGHIARGVPLAARQITPEYVTSALDASETVNVKLLRVGAVMAPNWVAAMLGLDADTPVYERRRLMTSEDGPVALSSVYVPVEIAVGTALTKKDPLDSSVREHLRTAAGLHLDYATVRVSARMPSADETELLSLDGAVPVLWVMVTARTPAGDAVATVDTVLPADRHDLEDTYPLG